MTIPDGFTQITVDFTGSMLPHGAAVVFGTERNIELTAAEHATAAHDALADAFAADLSSAVSMSGASCKFGPDETGAIGLSTGISRAGTAAGTVLPPSCAYLLTKVTGLGGRRGRGRMFLPGVLEGNCNNSGLIDSGVQSTITGHGTSFLNAMDVLGIAVYLLHDPSTEWVLINGQPRRVPIAGDPPAPTLVTSLVCDDTVSTQRRRLR